METQIQVCMFTCGHVGIFSSIHAFMFTCIRKTYINREPYKYTSKITYRMRKTYNISLMHNDFHIYRIS